MKLAPEPITTAIDFLKKIKAEDEAHILFKKKDGTDRLMRCTLNFNKIPKEHKPKDLKLENILALIKKNILHVYDLDASGWRSVPVDKTKWVEASGTRYNVTTNFWKK